MKKKSLCFNNNLITKEECSLLNLCDSLKCCYHCALECSFRCENDYNTCEHKCVSNKAFNSSLKSQPKISKKKIDNKKKIKI